MSPASCTLTVLAWTHNTPSSAAGNASAITSATELPSHRIEITASASATASEGEPATSRAVGGQRRGPAGGPVPHRDVQTGPQQAMGHAGTHDAGSQHRDAHQ